MSEPNPPQEGTRPPLPVRVIPTTDLPLFEDIATAFIKDGLQVAITKTSDQFNADGNSLDPEKEVKIALTGMTPDSPPDEVDVLLFEEAKDKVLVERQHYLDSGYRPELVTPALKSAVHITTAGVGIKKRSIKLNAELPGKLREIKEKLDRDTADILRRAAQRIPEIKRE